MKNEIRNLWGPTIWLRVMSATVQNIEFKTNDYHYYISLYPPLNHLIFNEVEWRTRVDINTQI